MNAVAKLSCAICAARFSDANGLWMHTKVKHGPKAARAVRPPRSEREPSMGERLAEAIQDAHAGEPVSLDLLLMFRDQFPRGTKAAAAPTEAGGTGKGERP